MELRNYQTEAIEYVRQSMAAGHTHPLLVMPTGSGKTVVALEIVRRADARMKRILFLAPRRELIYQATETFMANGLFAGMLMAGELMAPSARIQVASFDTLHARAVRRDRIILPPADLVIVDEAHLSLAPTKKTIINHYDRVIGLTATPARGDGKGLGTIYDDLVVGTDIRQLTDEGHLVPVRYYAPSKPDLEGVKIHGGDYVVSQLAKKVDKPKLIGNIIDNWQRLASDKRTVVFCTNRKHSRHITDEFARKGYCAEHLDGDTPLGERKAILDRVRSGETQVLCNVFVATYGLDIPPLECCVLARPTRNIALYLQTVGRVLRTFPGKEYAMVIDHAGAVEQHGFIDDPIPWNLDTKIKVTELKEQNERERKDPKDMVCPKCGYTARAARECIMCGWVMIPPSQDIPTKHADLSEVNKMVDKSVKAATMEDKAQFFAELKFFAASRGYKRGWANHKYREKFGVWPKNVGHLNPVVPSHDTAQWINQLQYPMKGWWKK